ncbi:hypothetical protein [Streptomyces sp. NBC_00388]|uniref:hypothetical protein n=1 Tax=Streptomyces sp. NBC_00388 TaxID=2975735 RepID=UPI002E1C8F67
MGTEARRAPFPSFPPRPGEPPPGAGEPPAGGPAAPAEKSTETTTRLRPVAGYAEPARPPGAPAGGAAVSPFPPAAPPPVTPPRPTAPPPPATAPSVPPPRPTGPPTAHRRPVGAVDLTPRPDAGRRGFSAEPRPAPAETPVETTTRLRPVPARRPARAALVAACVVLGLGLTGGATAGSLLSGDSAAAGPRDGFTAARGLWHSAPVDTLFPPSLKGTGAGPGGADRTWTRVGVAPDTTCTGRLDPMLLRALQPVGCTRLVRATYTDATSSSVTTVGMVFTEAGPAAMGALHHRFAAEGLDRRTDLMPGTYPVPSTPAASFGSRQRASWAVNVLTDAPVVVYAVSGFADGRTVADPQPAAVAMEQSQTTAAAQAGLGHEARGIEERVERALRKNVAAAEKP